MKSFLYFLAGAFTVIAIIAVYVFGQLGLLSSMFLLVGSGGSEYRVIGSSSSPDGKYVATVYSKMGGGAAGWCSIRVTVNPENQPFSIEREKQYGKYVVSDVSCGSEVEARWEGDRSLLITYKGPSGESGISVYKKPVDWDREVKIRYVEE